MKKTLPLLLGTGLVMALFLFAMSGTFIVNSFAGGSQSASLDGNGFRDVLAVVRISTPNATSREGVEEMRRVRSDALGRLWVTHSVRRSTYSDVASVSTNTIMNVVQSASGTGIAFNPNVFEVGTPTEPITNVKLMLLSPNNGEQFELFDSRGSTSDVVGSTTTGWFHTRRLNFTVTSTTVGVAFPIVFAYDIAFTSGLTFQRTGTGGAILSWQPTKQERELK